MKRKADSMVHESAVLHVTGKAVYVGDMDAGSHILYGHVIFAEHGHADVLSIEVADARKIPGVYCILTAGDIPGKNQMGPVFHDEPCLADKKVNGFGQAVAIIAAIDKKTALNAASFVNVKYKVRKPVPDIDTARRKGLRIAPERVISRGDANLALKNAPFRIQGRLYTGGQEHWYLETQSALCIPEEDGCMKVFASSQNPSETQAIVAEVLGIEKNRVECEVRRMGGGFGGKETQGNHVAAWAALLAGVSGYPVRIVLSRDDDQKNTGKRHPFVSDYHIGFDSKGKILAYQVELNADAGHAADLSMAILERAMLHAENAYYIPDILIRAVAWRTNNASNTAFRGFGGPQGMAVIESAIERIAGFLKKDSAEIRFRNFYRNGDRNITPYGQVLEKIRLQTLYEQIIISSDYFRRRETIVKFNEKNRDVKRGISITPVKFGISFTTTFLNQAGALVHFYTDGSIQVNHGGTEMGQGLYTKILLVASIETGLPPSQIRVTATNTSKIPNTSATAASSGSDLNGMAVRNAILTLKKRLNPVARRIIASKYPAGDKKNQTLIWKDATIYQKNLPDARISFAELVQQAYLEQISLSATGYYKTPGIHFNRTKGQGKPFHYFSYGMAVSEVETDLLTGNLNILRTDILQDVGKSINTSIDLGQVSGAFVQGLGWITTEELRYSPDGQLLTISPDTYKIPTIRDIPQVFNIRLLKNSSNSNTIHRSKAIGEPPFMLAFSVWMAIRDALASIHMGTDPEMSIPMTHEKTAMQAEKLMKLKREQPSPG